MAARAVHWQLWRRQPGCCCCCDRSAVQLDSFCFFNRTETLKNQSRKTWYHNWRQKSTFPFMSIGNSGTHLFAAVTTLKISHGQYVTAVVGKQENSKQVPFMSTCYFQDLLIWEFQNNELCILIIFYGTFCVCAERFQGLSKALHPYRTLLSAGKMRKNCLFTMRLPIWFYRTTGCFL